MITEKGTVKTSTQLNERMHSQLNGATRALSITLIVLGGLVLLAGFIILIASDNDALTFLILGSVSLIFGIVTVVSQASILKQIRQSNRVEEAEFFRDYLILREYADGEHVSTTKIYYKWLVRVKETSNYLFLYNTRVTAVPVEKSTLPINELNAVRKLLGRPAVGPAVSVQPYNPAQSGTNFNGNVNPATPPQDPFPETAPEEEAEEVPQKEFIDDDGNRN